jgi:hypothetical protein
MEIGRITVQDQPGKSNIYDYQIFLNTLEKNLK